MTPVTLGISESGRPIVYVAAATWYGGAASNRCLFSTRAEAIRWAKSQARMSGCEIDVNGPLQSDGYPDEPLRDDERLDPTFIVTWKHAKGGRVEVSKTEVCGLFDWSAYPRDVVTPAVEAAFAAEAPHRAQSREAVFREGYRAGVAWLKHWMGWALNGPIPWDAKSPADAESCAWQGSEAYSADCREGIFHFQQADERNK